MRTTLDLDDTLLVKAKALAAREHTSVTRLIEQGLALRLQVTGARVALDASLPVYPGRGGLRSTVVDATSHRALLDAADEA